MRSFLTFRISDFMTPWLTFLWTTFVLVFLLSSVISFTTIIYLSNSFFSLCLLIFLSLFTTLISSFSISISLSTSFSVYFFLYLFLYLLFPHSLSFSDYDSIFFWISFSIFLTLWLSFSVKMILSLFLYLSYSLSSLSPLLYTDDGDVLFRALESLKVNFTVGEGRVT